MFGIWRLIFVIYSLVLLFLSGSAILAAMGRPEPLGYINLALATSQNRVILGIAAIILFVLLVIVLVSALKKEPKPNFIAIEGGLTGQIYITVPAVKVIIMKAVKKVEGLKEVKVKVNESPEGLVVDLHIMINPELSVPEMSKDVQGIVKQYLEDIGGLQVAKISVLVDDFGTGKPASA